MTRQRLRGAIPLLGADARPVVATNDTNQRFSADVPQRLAATDALEYDRGLNVTRSERLRRIWIDPARCGGRPCIRGHRIWVSLVRDLPASGATVAEILADHPGLEEEDIRACLAHCSATARDRFVDIPLEAS